MSDRVDILVLDHFGGIAGAGGCFVALGDGLAREARGGAEGLEAHGFLTGEGGEENTLGELARADHAESHVGVLLRRGRGFEGNRCFVVRPGRRRLRTIAMAGSLRLPVTIS